MDDDGRQLPDPGQRHPHVLHAVLHGLEPRSELRHRGQVVNPREIPHVMQRKALARLQRGRRL